MDTDKYGDAQCLYTVVVAWLNKGLVLLLDEGVVACLYKNNNKGGFYVDIRHNLDECFEYFLLTLPL